MFLAMSLGIFIVFQSFPPLFSVRHGNEGIHLSPVLIKVQITRTM